MTLKNKLYPFLITLILVSTQARAQFSKADTLRGMLSPLRTCYDIQYYHLDIAIDVNKKWITGSNLFQFTATEDFQKLQFDLFENMSIEKIIYQDKSLPFTREYQAVFINFPKEIKKGTKSSFKVYYKGSPLIAKNAPWDGGFVFKKDQKGRPWVGVAVQGTGASLWWPNKDHQSDEVDSMHISITIPDKTLKVVSNGQLKAIKNTAKGRRFDYFVSYPINNYNVTVNIGHYTEFKDHYTGKNGPLNMSFHVLDYNLGKAKKHFAEDIKPMFDCFEHWFGAYPFYRDSYKLVETPYLGMEHQSAVAYGNKYQKGYLGTDLSQTGWGMKWDYIIIHETGHEWFGNNITSRDIADMWIHEGFTTYSESLYTECRWGKQAGAIYVAGQRKKIKNDIPIIGPYHVNKEGSGDMYFKGANLLHMIRTIINDDEKWLNILRGLNRQFGLKTTTTEEVVHYISQNAGKDLTKVFDQYLRFGNIPTLETKQENGKLYYRWKADIKDFDMPLRILNGEDAQWIYPAEEWKSDILTSVAQIDTLNFYIHIK